MVWIEVDDNSSVSPSTVINVADANFTVSDDVDPTKGLKFQLSGLTTATTRTLTVPDANTTIAGTDATQTLTNKTINLASNTLSGTKAEFNTALSDDNFAVVGADNAFTAAQTISASGGLTLSHASAGVKERGRSIAMGEWSGVNNGVEFGGYTFNAADFTGSASMTWTVALADIVSFMYTIIGNTMIIIFELEQTSVGGTPDTQLKFKIPASKVALAEVYGWARLNDNGGAVAAGQCATFTAGGGDTYVSITKLPLANWTAATNTTNVAGQINLPIQA